MERQLRFRIWDNVSKRYFNAINNRIFISLDGKPYFTEPMLNGDWVAIIPWIDHYKIEQFTGFVDKNGRDVYEGDIVIFCFNGRKIVKCKNNEWNIYVQPGSISHYQIIGDINENSDLISK